MGDPIRLKKHYAKPVHPWQKERIDEEETLLAEYGLKNKREIWKADSLRKKFARQSKKLVAMAGAQAELEKEQLLARLQRLGLVKPGAGLDQVLGLKVRDVLERRLQTLLLRKGLAKTMEQARQFITHKHIMVGKHRVSIPSYLVTVEEEPLIDFASASKLSNPEHPARLPKKTKSS